MRRYLVCAVVALSILAVSAAWSLFIPSALGDRVFYDADGNNVESAGDTGIVCTVTLTGTTNGGAAVNASMQTDANGYYKFGNLLAGTYTVTVSGVNSNYEQVYEWSGDTDGVALNGATSVVLPAGTTNLNLDFGYVEKVIPPSGKLGDWVFIDADNSGDVTSGDTGIAGVTVTLSGPVSGTAVTDANGYYLFTDLPAGTYIVTVDASTLPEGYEQTYDLDGTATADTATGDLAEAQTRLDFDFGYYKDTTPPPPDGWITCTQGGWGSKPKGMNPGMVLLLNFSKVGPIVVGGPNTITLTTAKAVENFLPQGGTAVALTTSYINPTKKLGVLAGQVVAMTINVKMSAAGVTPQGLGGLFVTSGLFAGKTVNELLAAANAVLGGGSLPAGVSISDLNDACTAVNENYCDGANKGFLSYTKP